MNRRGQLRILFFMGDSRLYRRHYADVVANLVERGHEVEVAFQRSKGDLPGTPPTGVTYGFAPERDLQDGWRSVAWLVRALADLARYSHPRFARALELRRRMTQKIVGNLHKSQGFEPVGRRLALRQARRLASTTDEGLSERVIRRAARLEDAIPTSKVVDAFVRDRAPDVVLATPVVNRASTQVDALKTARRLGIPTGICVASWDNLTNKGLLRFVPERLFVWNEVQVREAVDLHGIPAERVVATGGQVFDEWFERRPSSAREEFVARVGLDPSEPYVLYVCSNPAMTKTSEAAFVLEWADALRSGADERLRRIGILIRPHPNEPGQWQDADLNRLGNGSVWPREGALPLTESLRADFYDSLAHSAAVVGINTTAMIEGAIAGKSVLTVLAPGFAQESTLHFHYLLADNGGFLHVGSSLAEHAEQLGRVLEEDASDAQRRLRFVESFVRPRGLDRPAAPILAEAIEELAGLRAAASARFSLLRLPLAIEAGLCSLALRRAPARRVRRSPRLRQLQKRVAARARAMAR